MINDSRGTSADTMSAVPDAFVLAEARTPFPTASVSERGGHAGEDVVDNEKCVGGSRVAGPAVGTPSASSSGNADNPVGMMAARTYHAWTDAERAAVQRAYNFGGPRRAVAVGTSFGITRSATLSYVDHWRTNIGLSTWAEVRRESLAEVLAEMGTATTVQLANITGLSRAGVRKIARDLGWIETKTRWLTWPGRCEQSWRLPS